MQKDTSITDIKSAVINNFKAKNQFLLTSTHLYMDGFKMKIIDPTKKEKNKLNIQKYETSLQQLESASD